MGPYTAAVPRVRIVIGVAALFVAGCGDHERLQSDDRATVDLRPQLELTIDSPDDGETVSARQVTISGRSTPGSTVGLAVGDAPGEVLTVVDRDGSWSARVPLAIGSQRVIATARRVGNDEAEEGLELTRR